MVSEFRKISPNVLLIIFIIIFCISLFSKMWGLGDRVMHHDESLHAYFAWELAFGEGYQHNPMMHGPLQMEAIALIFKIFGDSNFFARFLHAIIGSLLVFLPYFFRFKLGSVGAIFSACLITISPSILYFSRFARNDIIVVFLTLSLVIVIWNYIDSGKKRNLYLISLISSLLFCTKETGYLIIFSLSFYLFLYLIIKNHRFFSRIYKTNGSVKEVLVNQWKIFLASVVSLLSVNDSSRYKTLLFLMIGLVLPISAGIFSILQDLSLFNSIGLILASSDYSIAPVGTPYGGGKAIAFYIVLSLTLFSIFLGAKYIGLKIWWKCFVIFYLLFIILFTVFFTDFNGISSGFWASLGYWIIQQDVARGGQPWFYYILLMIIYEFVVFVIGIFAIVYYIKNKDKFGIFLSYWVVVTFLLYGIASEKMPWLLINMVLPLTILGGKFLSDVYTNTNLMYYKNLKFVEVFYKKNYRLFFILPVAILFVIWNIFISFNLTYKNSDTPFELLIYTQTSPDVKAIMSLIEKIDNTETVDKKLIFIDSTNGFSWPWVWYLRHYKNVVYSGFVENLPHSEDEYFLAIIHSNNVKRLDQIDGFNYGIRFKHRWWFPEEYKTALSKPYEEIFNSIVDYKYWQKSFLYLWNRSLDKKLGSEDGYFFIRSGYNFEYTPKAINQTR